MEPLYGERLSYTVEAQVPESYMDKMFEYIYSQFLIPQDRRFVDLSNSMVEAKPQLSYTILDASGKKMLGVQIRGGKPLEVTMNPISGPVHEHEVSMAKEDIDVAVDFFEDQVRKNTIFFAWREGETIVPEKVAGPESKSLQRIFLETQVILIVVMMGAGIILIYFIGPLVPIVILAIQLVAVFYSNKLIGRAADWKITANNPTIHLLEFPISPDANPNWNIPKEQLVKLKQEIYERTIATHGELNCSIAGDTMSKYGLVCKEENLTARKVNAYDLVKRTVDKFSLPMPEIVVANTLMPNASASGPSPSRGVVLMTTGLFVYLNDDEIVNVLGHELGHLKGRDPLWLYGLSASQYLLWFYVIFGLFPMASFGILFLYLLAASMVVYFIAKFFEARADLISAMVIGEPLVMADALEKIGFQRLLYERLPAFRIQAWLRMDPHPPISFRIARLRNLKNAARIRHPLIQSAKDVVHGFTSSFT